MPGRPLAAMIGNLLGYEVFRAASGSLPAETAGRILVQDTASLDVTAEPLFPHPRCPFCAPGETEDAPWTSPPPAPRARPRCRRWRPPGRRTTSWRS